jgi:hypothetical protein
VGHRPSFVRPLGVARQRVYIWWWVRGAGRSYPSAKVGAHVPGAPPAPAPLQIGLGRPRQTVSSRTGVRNL